VKLAANLSLLFTELPLLQRVAAAAAAGFEGVEIQFPYEVPARALQAALACSTGGQWWMRRTSSTLPSEPVR